MARVGNIPHPPLELEFAMLYLIFDDSFNKYFNRDITLFNDGDGCFIASANNDEELTNDIISYINEVYVSDYDYNTSLEDYDGSRWTVRPLGEEFQFELGIEQKFSGRRL